MKNIDQIKNLLLAGLLVVLTGCINLNFETKGTDFNGLLSQDKNVSVDVEKNGIKFDTFELYNQDEVYPYGKIKTTDTLNLEMAVLTGFDNSDGYVYPQMDIEVFDSQGEYVDGGYDVLPEVYSDGLSDTVDLTLTSYMKLSDQINLGEVYDWRTTVRDQKSDKYVQFDVYFRVG